jgi:hypothetical protein
MYSVQNFLLGCNAVENNFKPTFQRCVLPPSSGILIPDNDNYFTRQYIPEDNSELHTRRRENLKSHNVQRVLYCGWVCRPLYDSLSQNWLIEQLVSYSVNYVVFI